MTLLPVEFFIVLNLTCPSYMKFVSLYSELLLKNDESTINILILKFKLIIYYWGPLLCKLKSNTFTLL